MDFLLDVLVFIWNAFIWGFLIKMVAMRYLAIWTGKKIEKEYTSKRSRFPTFLSHFQEKHDRDINECHTNHCATL
jgi:hypothetical protein